MAKLEISVVVDLPRRAESLATGPGGAELLRQEVDHIVDDGHGYEERHRCKAMVEGHLISERPSELRAGEAAPT